MLSSLLPLVVKNISERKLRSWLTIVGIVIGVAAIVSLVALSRSLESSIIEEFETFGTDKITVVARGDIPGLASGLTIDDEQAVERVRGLEWVESGLSKSTQMTHKDETKNVILSSWEAKASQTLFEEFGFEFEEGASFTHPSKKAVLGSRAANDLFESQIGLRSKIKLQGSEFEVIGILKPIGNPSDDSAIYIPLEELRTLFNDEQSISFIVAKVSRGQNVQDAAQRIERSLEKIRSEESFSVLTAEQFLEQLKTILGILQGVLVGIAAISLLVGSIGIASSLYTSVLERTRDIGIMKALGASNTQITAIFLGESALLGFVGGLLGVLLGFLIAQGVSKLAVQAGFSILRIKVEPLLMLVGLLFAVGVATISGFFPARRAARLKPVEALRK